MRTFLGKMNTIYNNAPYPKTKKTNQTTTPSTSPPPPLSYQRHHVQRCNHIAQIPRTVRSIEIVPAHILIAYNAISRPRHVHLLDDEFETIRSDLFDAWFFCVAIVDIFRIRPVEEVKVHDERIGFLPLREGGGGGGEGDGFADDVVVEWCGADEESEAEGDEDDAGVEEATIAARLGVEFHFEFLEIRFGF